MIRNIQEYWAKQKKPRLKGAADAFGISSMTAKRYLSMTQEDISRLDHPNHYKKRESSMNAWLNVIYKMMADGCSNELIYFYIKRQKAFHESERNLADYIYLIGKNNFPDRTPFNAKTVMEWVLPPGVIIITRTDLLKYILTCNPKTKRDPNIEKYIDQIKSQYPVVEKVETMFKEIIYVFLTIFSYLLKRPQSLILSALRAFFFCGKPHISRSIFLYFRYQAWLKSW